MSSEQSIKVSVVVPTYNQERYIRHTLESAVNQKTDFGYEILVGEDCSTDNTSAVVREYAQKYPDKIVAFIREKNYGMGGNVMDLMMRAKGDYIAFLEGDDYWLDENKLQKQVDFLNTHPDYVAVFGKCIMVDENENRLEEIEKYNGFFKRGGEYTIRDFQDYLLPGQTATSMYRKVAYGMLQQKLTDAGIDISKMIDRDQILCMLAVGKMHAFEDVFAAYRYVLDSKSGSWSSKNDFYSTDNVIKYLNGLKNMEKMASALDLPLNFDNRRKREFEILGDMKKDLSREDAIRIRKAIMSDYNSKLGLFRFLIERQLGKIVRPVK